MEKEEDCTELIILQDQTSLLDTLVKNLSILRNELPQVAFIDVDLEMHLQSYKEMLNNLTIKLESLKHLSERLNDEDKKRVIKFVGKINDSCRETIKKTNDEYSNYLVISQSVYGLPLRSLLSEIKKETSAIRVSLQIGEVIYDNEFIVQSYIYYNEISRLLNCLEGCDKRIQQYLIISKIMNYLQELDVMIDAFASKNNLLTSNEEDLSVFSAVFSLLTGELLGWKPISPGVILKQNSSKKPVFITKNTKRTQVKRLANLPLFHSMQK